MVQINNLVGKVMTGNVGALGRYGVTLSDSQAKILQNGNEAQRTAMLIEVLGQNYGKVNEALRNTPQGRITALKNSFNDFQEIVGASLTKVFDPLVKRFQNWVDSMGGAEGAMQKLEDLVKNNQDKLKLFAIFVGTILTAAFASWAVSVIAATWPILAVAAGITLLYLAFKKYEPQIKKVVDKFKDFWNTIKPIREFLVNQFKKAWEDLTNAIDRIKKQLEPFEKQIKQIGIIIGIIVIGPFALFMAAILGTIAVIVIIVTFIARLIGWFAQLQAKVMEVASNINQWFKDLPGKIWGFMSSAGSWLVDAGKNLINGLLNGIKNKWTEVWNFLTGIAGGVKSAVSNLWGALWDNGWHLMNSLWEGMKNVWNKVTEWVKGLATWIKKNKGPIDKDRKMLVNEGNAIMVGLNRGLLSGYRVVQDTIASINNSISKSIQPSLVVTGNAPTGNTSVNNNIYGNITLGDQGAVDRFFDQLNRNNELARRGMTTV
jgi:hypothetical protein